jgi:hypothetical protein
MFDMAQHDDLLVLTRPAHVRQHAWETCLSEYQTALVRYESAVDATNHQICKGLTPTSDQEQAERLAHGDLSIARAVLLNLYRRPATRH